MILIVDDHADSRRVLVRLLEMEGYIAVSASGGVEALALLKTVRPRLILLDYGMPDMNGLEVFLEIKMKPALARTPVVMFSAYDGELRDRALAAGIDAYVMKASLDWSDLHHVILRLAGPAGSPSKMHSRIDRKNEI